MTSTPASSDHPAAADAVVVIAHGSRSEEANDAHRATCALLAERSGRVVSPAFLELASPSLAEAVTTVVEAGATGVVVLPFFLYPGRHMQRDIPALVDAARSEHPSVDIALGPLFGADPGVIDLLIGQLGG
ncbi:MAG: CbiX/SirB N-terminal domain-containing protein [Acidimicrobiales bacterium]